MEDIEAGVKEGIRRGIRDYLGMYRPELEPDIDKFVSSIFSYLSSQGVMRKVDEMPPLISKDIYDDRDIGIAKKQLGLMLKEGWVKVRPLGG